MLHNAETVYDQYFSDTYGKVVVNKKNPFQNSRLTFFIKSAVAPYRKFLGAHAENLEAPP